MRLIDSHAHLLSEGFDADREVLLGELAEQMEAVMECASAPQDFPRVAELVQAYPFLYGAVGVHPEEIAAWSNQAAEQIAQYLHCPKIQAVGEIGLDYHWQPETAPLQKQALVTQLELARSANKPVILHNREATADLYDILQAHRGLRGVVHCFVDGPEIARKAMDLGYYLGFGGVITFKNAGAAAEAARYAPMDRILLETDCPYLAPVPRRGKRNRPDYVRHTAQKLAELKGLSVEQVVEAANANARALFGLPAPQISQT